MGRKDLIASQPRIVREPSLDRGVKIRSSIHLDLHVADRSDVEALSDLTVVAGSLHGAPHSSSPISSRLSFQRRSATA